MWEDWYGNAINIRWLPSMWAVMSLLSGLMAESYHVTLYVPLNFVGVRVAFIMPVFQLSGLIVAPLM